MTKNEKKDKRENGTGSIYKRKNGTWVGVIRETGKKAKYISGKTEAEVKKKLRELQRQSNNCLNVSKVSLETYLRNWIFQYKYGTIKKTSFDRLESTIEHQIVPFIGSLHMDQVTSDDIQGLLNSLKYEVGLS